MTVTEFISKWQKSALNERAAAQSHFLDLCELFQHAKPADVDPTGEWFAFEKGVAKQGGKGRAQGWADVWKRGFFGWEYKGKHKDLEVAYDQLLKYRESLENPPLLVVSDINRIVIRTNWTNTPTQKYEIPLAELGQPVNFEMLRNVFHNPEALKPGVTVEEITQKVAEQLGDIAWAMQQRALEPTQIARFLDRIVFCLFAEDIDLLPAGLFARIVEQGRFNPPLFANRVAELFDKMATGGWFGEHQILHFNGSLFDDAPVLEMKPDEIDVVRRASLQNWRNVDPSIFGALFERALEGVTPDIRSQLGAHYTSRADIETLIEPIVMQPLRREWEAVQSQVEAQLESNAGKAQELVEAFAQRLASVKVLDPACGSGNFLYVTLQKLKDFEKSCKLWCEEHGLRVPTAEVRPEQLQGIEINAYAFDLAQTTLWIGYLQWLRENGQSTPAEPILRSTGNFRNMDAILDLSDADNPQEPQWPQADFIVGNPPFLGDKLMRGELGDDYVNKLRKLYAGRIPGQSDLCCYWFEKARQQIVDGSLQRAGLIATQGIRGGANRKVLERIKESGDIFFAESDRPWILNGANVHISMVGFDAGKEAVKVLDQQPSAIIHANLTSSADVTEARVLNENLGMSFLGSCKGGPFDISENAALAMLHTAGNPHGKPNSDVLRPVFNSEDLLKRTVPRWIIDNADIELEEACLYEAPHHTVEKLVKPMRDVNRDKWLRENWWRPQRMRPAMREAVAPLKRFIVTTTTSKHRLFLWLYPPSLPDHQLIVFARDDDYFFGILHSRLHEVWARAQGTQLRERESGFRYTPTTCFETFPFPTANEAQQAAIGEPAKVLCERRDNWLNPPEWMREEILEFPGSVDGPWARYVHEPNSKGIGTVRYPRLALKNPLQVSGTHYVRDLLPKRTLTNLYNERPAWLDLAHRKLDEAVFAAYSWPVDLSDEQILERLLALNLERA
jgi:hypothetical protein